MISCTAAYQDKHNLVLLANHDATRVFWREFNLGEMGSVDMEGKNSINFI